MKINIFLSVIFITMVSAWPAYGSDDRALTDAEWQEDLGQMDRALREEHFSLFKLVEEDVYSAAVAALRDKIPTLDDQEIVLEMAKIVSLLKDGHTRLAMPRAYPSLALLTEYGHSGTKPPKYETLKLASLPVSFYLFEDGLFITGANRDNQHLIGKKVLKIGDKTTEEAIEAVKPYAFYENDSRANLMAPDRLSLPKILQQVGIVEDTSAVTLTLEGKEGEETVTLTPLAGPLTGWNSYAPENIPLWQQDKGKYWYQVLPDQGAIYVRFDEFVEVPNPPIADFVAETISAAREAGAENIFLICAITSAGQEPGRLRSLLGLVEANIMNTGNFSY